MRNRAKTPSAGPSEGGNRLLGAHELGKVLGIARRTVSDYRTRGIIEYATGRLFDPKDCRRRIAEAGITLGLRGLWDVRSQHNRES